MEATRRRGKSQSAGFQQPEIKPEKRTRTRASSRSSRRGISIRAAINLSLSSYKPPSPLQTGATLPRPAASLSPPPPSHEPVKPFSLMRLYRFSKRVHFRSPSNASGKRQGAAVMHGSRGKLIIPDGSHGALHLPGCIGINVICCSVTMTSRL